MYRISTAFGLVLIASCLASAQTTTKGSPTTFSGVVGPVQDVTYEVIWLIESDDVNREPYDGPAVEGLESAGYGRLVQAGSATAAMTVGKPSSVAGTSRSGQLTALTSLLNTTEKNELLLDAADDSASGDESKERSLMLFYFLRPPALAVATKCFPAVDL